MAGTGMVAPGVTVDCCVTAPAAGIDAAGTGDPLGLTAPDAVMLLLGVI
ncbi:hypothetical protein ACFOY2_39325 [Nonomuraea purpurea]|uniref:Uncharacterized protein n=1 Tax=Nonomuraea purpurea TaxID=1849276 RepID=A0ABV8GHM5_9ACTN